MRNVWSLRAHAQMRARSSSCAFNINAFASCRSRRSTSASRASFSLAREMLLVHDITIKAFVCSHSASVQMDIDDIREYTDERKAEVTHESPETVTV